MKIGINLLPIRGQKTGTGVYSKNLLDNLLRLYPEDEFYIFVNAKADKFLDYKNEKVKIISFGPVVSNPYTRILWEQLIFPFVIKKYNLDLLHSVGNIMPIFYKGKNVVTIHDLTQFMVSNRFSMIKKLYLKYFTGPTVGRAAKIIAVSNNTKKDILEKYKVPEEKIRVIYESNSSIFKYYGEKERGKVLGRYGVKDNYFLYIGSLEPGKNVEGIIEAFHKVAHRPRFLDLFLVVVGKKAWKYKTIFEAVKKYDLEKKVIFTGYVPEDELPYFYSGAKFFIFPSLYEGFGLPPLEAMACDLPIIVSNQSSLPEVVGNAGLFVDPHNPKEIAEAMTKILADKTLRNDLVKKGRERLKMFSWETCAKETFEVYKEVIGKK